jgi:hypothetical protein
MRQIHRRRPSLLQVEVLDELKVHGDIVVSVTLLFKLIFTVLAWDFGGISHTAQWPESGALSWFRSEHLEKFMTLEARPSQLEPVKEQFL